MKPPPLRTTAFNNRKFLSAKAKATLGVFQLIIILSLLSACAKSAVRDEIKSLLDSFGTANGSDLILVLCGWPASAKPRLLSLDLELAPESGLKAGSGTADISAACGSFDCRAKISFIYSQVTVGGHGYGGGRQIQLGGFKRLSAVDPSISDPPNARALRIGEKTAGRLSEKSARLPDGSSADYYSIDLQDENPLVRFELAGERGLNPRGYIYQNNLLIDGFICSLPDIKAQPYDNVSPLEKGKAVILITAGAGKGEYTILLEVPDNSARSMLRLPERYRKKPE